MTPDECHHCIANHIETHTQTALKIAEFCRWREDHMKEFKETRDKWEKRLTVILVGVISTFATLVIRMAVELIR